MAFNNLTTMLASGKQGADYAFSTNDELQAAWRMWHMALQDTMAGKPPFSREADVIADASLDAAEAKPVEADKPEMTYGQKTAETPPTNPLDELVEDMPWTKEGESLEDLKQKGVALMTSKWATPIDAADELRKELGLPQDWSQMTADQWHKVIDFAEAKE
jgi:hypothetical protein